MRSFVNYSSYRIDMEAPSIALLFIMIVILLLGIATRKRAKKAFFDLETTQSLRGMAVIALLLGHLSSMCFAEGTALDSAGYWAVITFLFISGYGLQQRYAFANLDVTFWVKRLSRLYPPLWISLALFLILDYILIGMVHPWYEIVFNLLGGHFNGALVRVNAPAWFVQYILILYVLYFAVSRTVLPESTKLAMLFVAVAVLYLSLRFTPILRCHSIWLQYTLVFPLGVSFAFWHARYPGAMVWLKERKLLPGLLLFTCAILFLGWPGAAGSGSLSMILRPLPFLIALVMLLSLDTHLKWHSGLLLFLGNCSYEIYLLHLPFMVKYDFFLFRRPFVVAFFMYGMFIVSLAVVLQRVTAKCRGKMVNIRFLQQSTT